jgi:hypothetical protein
MILFATRSDSLYRVENGRLYRNRLDSETLDDVLSIPAPTNDYGAPIRSITPVEVGHRVQVKLSGESLPLITSPVTRVIVR